MVLCSIDELIAELRKDDSPPDIERLREMVGADIKVVIETAPEQQRVLLSTLRFKADFTRELARQCNGLVLGWPGWNILARPAGCFNPNFAIRDLPPMTTYKIYPVRDGTVVTLYYYADKWCMSSTNGFDIGGYKWMGPLTYSDALNEVLRQYPDFSFDALDRAKSYTIGFRHNDFHPLRADPAAAWLICVDGAAVSEQAGPELKRVGLPEQSPVEVKTYADLIAANKSALAEFRRDNNVHHYGWILRGGSGAHSDLLMESGLLRAVRSMIYKMPRRPHPVGPDNRMVYISLRAWLGLSRGLYLDLVPAALDEFRRFERFFADLTKDVALALQIRPEQTTPPSDDPRGRLIEALAAHMREYNINPSTRDAMSIIHNFITDRTYLDVYFSVITSAPNS